MSKPRRGIRKLKRFVVIDSIEASKFLDDSINPERSYLCERMPDGQLRELGSDNGEPEDNTFRRDWSWVVVELNKLADELEKERQVSRDLRAELLEALVHEQDGEPTPVAVIQAAADEAAAELNKLADEVAQLQRSLRIADEALRIKESLLEAYRARTPQAKLRAQLERRREFLEHEIRHGGEGGHLSARLSEVEHLIARLGLDKDGS